MSVETESPPKPISSKKTIWETIRDNVWSPRTLRKSYGSYTFFRY